MESFRSTENNDNQPLKKGELVTMRDLRQRASAQRELGAAPYVIAKVAPTGLYIVGHEDFDRGVEIPDGHPLMLSFPYIVVLPEQVAYAGPERSRDGEA